MNTQTLGSSSQKTQRKSVEIAISLSIETGNIRNPKSKNIPRSKNILNTNQELAIPIWLTLIVGFISTMLGLLFVNKDKGYINSLTLAVSLALAYSIHTGVEHGLHALIHYLDNHLPLWNSWSTKTQKLAALSTLSIILFSITAAENHFMHV